MGDEVIKTWHLYYFHTGRAERQLSGGRGGAGDLDTAFPLQPWFFFVHGLVGVVWGRDDY